MRLVRKFAACAISKATERKVARRAEACIFCQESSGSRQVAVEPVSKTCGPRPGEGALPAARSWELEDPSANSLAMRVVEHRHSLQRTVQAPVLGYQGAQLVQV